MDSVSKILVLRYRSIGDILLANPALAALRRRFAGARISLVVDDIFKELLFENPNVDEVIAHPRRSDAPKWKVDLEMIRRFREEGFDMAVDLQSGPRGAWASLLSGAGIRVGHPYRLRNRLCYNIHGEKPLPEDHTWEVQFKTVRPLGIDWPEEPEFHLAFPSEKAASMKKKLEEAGLLFDRPLALLHPGARVGFKRWPAARMGQIGRWLVDERNAAVVLCGTEADADEIKAIRRASGYALPFFTGLSLGELAALIRMSSLVVCNDSGPMHMAGVLNTPTVALFGPSDPAVWEPVGSRKITLSCHPPMECMPCDQKGCPHEGHHCMTRIEPDEVKRAVDKLKALEGEPEQQNLL